MTRILCSMAPLSSPLGRRGTAPAPKGPREGTRVGIVEQRSDLAHLHRGVYEHLPGYLEAALVHEFLEAGAQGIQTTIQRAAVHREECGDLACLAVTCDQRRAQHASHVIH